jgi:hypothetical protein
MKQIQEAQATWMKQARADQEYGGDKLHENLASAKKALDTFGSPEFKSLLKESGLGNHPELIRAFVRVGKAISEDRLISGTVNPTAKADARIFYPNSKHN